jgi:hypothetical protein
VVFDANNFLLAASPSLTNPDFLCELGPTVNTIGTHLTTAGTSPPAPRQSAPKIPPGFEPPVANILALAVPPGFLPQAATTVAPPPVTIGLPTRTWPASPVTYIRREVGAGATGTRGALGAALRREVGAGATGTHGAPRAAPSRAQGTGATGTRGAPGPAPSPEVGAGATGTRDAPRAALRQEVSAGAAATREGPRATLSREVGAGATVTRGGPGAALSRESGTTPPSPPPRPSARSQGMVVPITPPDNPHRMITRGKTGFKVVHDRLVLTVVTSSPTPSPIPSSARAALADPHWRAAMEDE